MRVAIIASPEVNFSKFDMILPRAATDVLIDGSGVTERNAREYCALNGIHCHEFHGNDQRGNLMKMMELADLIILLRYERAIETGSILQSAVLDKMVHCYFVCGNQLCTPVPSPFSDLQK